MRFKKIAKVSLIATLIILIILLSAILIVFTKSIEPIRNLDISLNYDTTAVCKILDANNEIINKISVNSNTYTTLSNISPNVIKAFISIEDKKFYKHKGLNYLRIGKALLNNLKAGKIKEGASTISQQLIKNKYLTNEKSIDRKIKEMYLTIKLEANEDKDKILESYLNTIYYGNGAYGINEASNRFFSKSPSELSLSESAIIAGVVKSPATYSPINNIDNCIQRRNLVLKEMWKDNAISKEEYDEAINENIELNISPIMKFDNLDLYSKKVIDEASKILNVSKYEILNNGYTIYTYQDAEKQQMLDKIINDEQFYSKNKYDNIADSMSIIIDNDVNGIIAVSGRSKYDLTSFKRQPGSLVKPVLVYAPAYEENLIYPCSQILDEKITIDNYAPSNVSDIYYGNISVRDCVAKSLNIPTIKLCNKMGVENCKNYAKKAGLNFSDFDTGLSVSLGGMYEGVTLEEISNSYSPFLNDGYYKNSGYISKILSPQNLTIYDKLSSQTEYCSKDTAYLMTENLIYASKKGTSKLLKNCGYDVASKTGTVNVKNSNLNTDAYSLAYTTKHIISTWLGNYSMDEKYHLNGDNNGGTFATKIVKEILDNLYRQTQPENFKIPDGIISLPIDIITRNNTGEIKLGYNMPDKYIDYEIFSTNNIPILSSTLLENLPKTQLKNMSIDDEIILEFDTIEYCNYQIYRLENNRQKLIKTITNHNGIYTFADTDIEYNKDYEYYILVSSPYSNTIKKTNSVLARINKEYNNYITRNTDNLSWIFS